MMAEPTAPASMPVSVTSVASATSPSSPSSTSSTPSAFSAAGLEVALRHPAPIALDAQFACAPGELLALVGPSGCGKTSLLRAVAGLFTTPHLSGHIRVGGELWFERREDGSRATVCAAPQARRVGMVFQDYALFPHLNVAEHLRLAADTRWSEDDLRALLERLGLSDLRARKPAALSGGQQQRVALARALVRVTQPSLGTTGAVVGAGQTDSSPSTHQGVLLLDEPFSAVDAPTRLALYEELAQVRARTPLPMILVTHDLQEARRLADRVVILDAGRSLQTGTPQQVFSSPRNARVAHLVGIANHFEGRFRTLRKARPPDSHNTADSDCAQALPASTPPPEWATLEWRLPQSTPADAPIMTLPVRDKGRIADGERVTWVLSGEWVDVQAVSDEPLAAHQMHAELVQVLSLGETSLCRFVPLNAAGQPLPVTLTFTLTERLLRRLGAQPPCTLRLTLAPESIHIMPIRHGRAAHHASKDRTPTPARRS